MWKITMMPGIYQFERITSLKSQQTLKAEAFLIASNKRLRSGVKLYMNVQANR